MSPRLEVVLDIIGLVSLAIAGFLIAPWAGFVFVGAVALVLGNLPRRPRSRRAKAPQ